MTSYQRGIRAEEMTAWYLRARGYKILARRYKTPVGEIDLVARRGGCIVFIEVKARNVMDDALYAVQPRQAARVMRAGQHFLASHNLNDAEIRFDVMAVAPPGHWRGWLKRGRVFTHIKGAFQV
jgi:putative endonuclease